jgi:hypothetical protein
VGSVPGSVCFVGSVPGSVCFVGSVPGSGKWRWRTGGACRDTCAMHDLADWLRDNWLLLVLGLGLLAFVIVTTYAISAQSGRRYRG